MKKTLSHEISALVISPMSIKKNFTWTLIGNLIVGLSQGGVLVILSKIGNIIMVGEYTYALAITSPIILLFSLQLTNVQATDAKNQFQFNDYLHIRFISSFIALIVIVFILFIGNYSFNIKLIIILVGLTKGIETVSNIIFSLLQKYERMQFIGISNILKAALLIFSMTMAVIYTNNLVIAVFSVMLAMLLKLIFFDFVKSKQFSQIRLEWNFSVYLNIFKKSIPLGIVSGLVSLNANIPRYFIEHYDGYTQLGYFSSIMYTVVAGNMIVMALADSILPRLAKYITENKVIAFKKLIIKFGIFSLLLGLIGVFVVSFWGGSLLKLLYQSSYGKYNNIFLLIMFSAAIGFMNTCIQSGITAFQAFKIQLWLFVLVTSMNLIFNYFLVDSKGMEGAADALIISSLIQFILSYFILLKLVKDKLSSNNYQDLEIANMASSSLGLKDSEY